MQQTPSDKGTEMSTSPEQKLGKIKQSSSSTKKKAGTKKRNIPEAADCYKIEKFFSRKAYIHLDKAPDTRSTNKQDAKEKKEEVKTPKKDKSSPDKKESMSSDQKEHNKDLSSNDKPNRCNSHYLIVLGLSTGLKVKGKQANKKSKKGNNNSSEESKKEGDNGAEELKNGKKCSVCNKKNCKGCDSPTHENGTKTQKSVIPKQTR